MSLARIALALLLYAATPAVAVAHEYVIDQQCWPPETNGAYSIQFGMPIGQEFVPTYGVMNVAEFHVVNGSVVTSVPVELYVVVHADSIGGPVLGTSLTTLVLDDFNGAVEFTFTVPVALTPGSRHALEVRMMEGDGAPYLILGEEDACPGITGIWEGHAFSNGADFLFRTGADEELPAKPSSWGAVKVRYR